MAKTTRRITLTKTSKNKLDTDKLVRQVQAIKLKAVARGLSSKGWSAGTNGNGWRPDAPNKDGVLTYKAQLQITLTSKRERDQTLIDTEYEDIVKAVVAEARKHQWEVLSTNDVKGSLKPEQYASVEIPKDWLKHFGHIYGRQSQIELILSRVHAGVRSEWHDRFHCLLVGPPASGKTESLRALGDMVGPDSILHLDATATTQAGAIRDLTERDEIPRLIAIEEIEKADEGQLKFLLGILDHRAEINKLNFRGAVKRVVRSMVLATVNDWKLFSGLMSGALASRFGKPILFPEPDEFILRKILEREVARVKGKRVWVDKTMEYVVQRRISDPRIVIQICLCGRDDLLRDKYQKMLDETDATNFLTARQRMQVIVPQDPDMIDPSLNGQHKKTKPVNRR